MFILFSKPFAEYCHQVNTSGVPTNLKVDIAVMEEIIVKSGNIPASPLDLTSNLYKELDYSMHFVEYRKSNRIYKEKDGLRAILICIYILERNMADKHSDLESFFKYLKDEEDWKLGMQYVGVIAFGVHSAQVSKESGCTENVEHSTS